MFLSHVVHCCLGNLALDMQYSAELVEEFHSSHLYTMGAMAWFILGICVV